MSDDWNHDQNHDEHHQEHHEHGEHGEHQGEWQPEAPAPETHGEPDTQRLAAVETAIAELKASFDSLKAGMLPAEAHHADEPQAASDPHADKLAAIEAELMSLRGLVGEIAENVKTHADLHAETRSIVDEQHQLMRGLNYIITSAIGTLTASARQVK